MNINYRKTVLLALGLAATNWGNAQCGTTATLGSSSNVFTHIRNAQNPVAADKDLNTIVFVHRNNAATFGGNSGQLRYDVSFNAGTTWTVNQGVLNPLATNLGRYPNVAIYNPTNNLTPSNAYLGYMAATIDPTTSAWNGVVSGVTQLNNTGGTENYNQPVVPPQLIPHSVVKGAPGVFWAIDAIFNQSYITGFTIYKGTWNSNAIGWVNNYTVTPPFNTGYSGIPQIGDYNIAFDPTGTFGWFSFLSHVTPGPSNYAFYPVFYKTVNGGATWTGPYQVDLNKFSCMTGNLASNNVLSTNFEHDLTVDVNGNPHLFTTVCNGSNAYGVFYTNWHHMYDITMKNGLWVAYDVSNVLAGRGSWGTSPNIINQDMSPQVGRSKDGTKIFFTWSDNSTYTLGQANLSPQLFGKAYNVTSDTWTGTKDFSSCNSSLSGLVIVPHVAAEVLEPSSSMYKLAPVYALMTANDPTMTANFNFIDNVTFGSSEFTVSAPAPATISIVQGTNVLLCPNSTISIGLPSTVGQAIWSTGSTNLGISISNPTITTYSVIAQQGCNTGTASISVTMMSVTATGPSQSFCDGQTATMSVSGNAVSYNWMPGNITGTIASVVTTTANQVYTVTAASNANCSSTATVALTVNPLPTVTIAGSTSVCIGSVLTLTAGGAFSYTWDTGPTGAVLNVTPTTNVSYTVTGEDVNACVSTQTIDVTIAPVPTVTAISNQTVICTGGTIALTAVGAISYTWVNNGAPTNTTSATPTITTVYTVTGEDANLCTSSQTVNVVVNPLPTVNVASSRPTLCVGEKAVLTATGAGSYTWQAGQATSTIQITPTVTTTYSLTGKDANGCVNTATFSQVVSPCAGLSNYAGSGPQFQVYPNPNNGDFTLKGDSRTEITIVSELGQELMQVSLHESNGFETKVTALPPGIYFVMARSEGRQLSYKLVVNR